MNRPIAFAAFLSAALFVSPVMAQDTGFASPDELNEKLVGNTFSGDMGSSEYTGYFAEDGMYHDASGSGKYQITQDGVCYPGTDFGCYAATISDDQLAWSQDGKAVGTGRILEGDAMNLLASK